MCLTTMVEAVIVFAVLASLADSSSFLGEPHPLHIVPDKDISLRIGHPLELFCILNETLAPNGSTSKDLKFEAYRLPNQSSWTSDNDTYSANETTIINKTTIRFYVPRPPPGENMYYCKLNASMRPISVFVGEKPEEVKDFSCISIEWNNLTCTWKPSDKWSSKNHYTLLLKLSGRAGRNPIPCRKNVGALNNTCVYEDESYRQAHEKFSFTLTGTNALGSTTQNFTIKHFDVVRPAPPLNLRQLNKTTNSCLIAWDKPSSFIHFPPGLNTVIEVKSERDATATWQTFDTSGLPLMNTTTTFNIEGLSFANTNYDVRVYFKNPGSSLRSDHASIIFRTLPTIPGAAPLTTPGCFDMMPANNSFSVVIYWRMIEDHLKNGDLFEYEVLCQRNGKEDCSSLMVETSSSYAKFHASHKDSYNFTIYSKNEIGRSTASSSIFVPRYNSVERPSPPTKTTYGDGIYGLTWSYKGHVPPHTYTVFYCENNKEEPLPCQGLLNWELVSGSEMHKNITVKNIRKVHQFGVAANEKDGTSSGISWATCVVSPNSVDFVVPFFDIHTRSSDTADVVWQLGCAENSALAGYIIYYCEQKSQHSTDCDGKEWTRNITNPLQRNTTIRTELKPYTSYQIQISIVTTGDTIGRRSEKKAFTTLEDAPDPPTNLQAREVTNSSICLEWDLPARKNGVIQKFLLFQFRPLQEHFTIEVQNKDEIDTTYEVSNLTSSTTYGFKLQACTGTACSNYSNATLVTTRMHFPKKVETRTVNVFNQTSAKIMWRKPDYLASTFVYQVLVKSIDDKMNRTFDFYGEEAIVPVEEFCEISKNKIKFSVRAINVDRDNNVTYDGAWSDTEQSTCDSQDADILAIALIIAVACFIGPPIIYFVYLAFLKMRGGKKVVIKLPPGLEPPCDQKEPWPPKRSNEDAVSGKPECADEQTLLEEQSKEPNERMPSYHESSASESSDCPVLPVDSDQTKENRVSHPDVGQWEKTPPRGDEEDEQYNNCDSDGSDSNERYPIVSGPASRGSSDHYVSNLPTSTPNANGYSTYVQLPTAPAAIKQPATLYVTLSDIKPPKPAYSMKQNESSFMNGNGCLPSAPSILNEDLNSLEEVGSDIGIELTVTPPRVSASASYVPHKAIVKI